MASSARKRCIHPSRKSTLFGFALWKVLVPDSRRQFTSGDRKRKETYKYNFLSFYYCTEFICVFPYDFACTVEKSNIYLCNRGWNGKNRCSLKEQKHRSSVSFSWVELHWFCWGFHPEILFSWVSLYSKKCPHREKRMWFPPPRAIFHGALLRL